MFVIFLLCIFLLYIQFMYLSLSKTIYGKNMDEFVQSRNTVKKNIKASRGTIYDVEGNALALNVNSYTVIAYLDEKRSENSSTPLHVEDIDKTASALASVLETDESYLKELLENGKKNNLYQVELGASAKGITELKKEEIEALNLPGIDFTSKQKRYYPNGDFASYVIGYAIDKEITSYDENDKEVKTNEITGELGIEAKYDNLLKGTDGYLEYEQDRYGYKIAGTKEINIPAENGYDVYLTIDAGIQRFVETAVKNINNEYNPEWVMIHVMDAKTGDILASSSTPSFNPNIRDITNYENPLVTYLFEPGSTMKTYTYMCALEKGVYDGNETFKSGEYKVGDDTVQDWNKFGWGTVSFDKGYEYSSNVGIANLIDRHLSRGELRDCFEKYGFGKKTNIELTRELKGDLDFKYPIEIINAGFGQGITTTAVQHLQALTMIANNGKMLKPHIVDKIINTNTNEVYYKSKVESEQIIKKTTAEKMKELMYNTVQGTDAGSTGYPYRIDGFDVIGKTGTSQIYDNETGTYIEGDNAYIFSFSGMYPYNDPDIIIYAAMKKPSWGKSSGLSTNVKMVMESIAKYRNMFTEITNPTTLSSIEVKSYISKDKDKVVKELQDSGINVIVIGNGNKIIKQSIDKGTLVTGDKIFLVTNDTEYNVPDFNGYSRNEIISLCKLLNIKYQIEGYGYVSNQSIAAGTKIDENPELTFTLTEKYNAENNEEKTE